jgi:hypothetical protein
MNLGDFSACYEFAIAACGRLYWWGSCLSFHPLNYREMDIFNGWIEAL